MKKLSLIRKTKAVFMKMRLHAIFYPLKPFLLNLVYMSELSKWRSDTKVEGYNDWYQKNWDYLRREKLYAAITQQENLEFADIDYLEFGVCSGNSFKYWLANNKSERSTFSGFDTFEGLPEAYGDFEKGSMSFSENALQISDRRAGFYKGLFQETLLPFLENYKSDRRKVVHMDADIFSATLFVFTQLHKYFNDGDIIIFDEFAVPTHEFRAFEIYTKSFYVNYEVIAAANNYLFLAIKIKK